MMFENVANLGDKIRAYDFAQFGEKASFIEGTVVDKGSCDDKYYACYKIKLTKREGWVGDIGFLGNERRGV